MDNLTHTLIGALVAKTAVPVILRLQKREHDPAFARAALWTAIVASNLPDADVVLSSLAGEGLGDGKAGYLLMHRGHTHTLIIAGLMGAAIGLICKRLFKTHHTAWLIGLGILSAFLHIAADAWNTYGVHPFYPFSNRWIFGDFIFIIEPLLWFVLFPYFAAQTRLRGLRAILALSITAAFGLLLFGPFTKPSWLLGTLAAWGMGWAALHALLKATPKRALITAWSGVVGVLALFWGTSLLAKQTLSTTIARQFPGERITDRVVSPEPSNPLCWNAIAVTDTADEYRAHHYKISLAPHRIPPQDCWRTARAQNISRTAPLQILTTAAFSEEEPFASRSAYLGSFTAKIRDLTELMNMDCRFELMLKFYRVPFWSSGETNRLIGDLRFDREQGLGFSELILPRHEPESPAVCSGYQPPWGRPFIQRFFGRE